MKVIKFGAIWCPACLIMRPRYNKVFNNYTDIENIEYDYDMDSDMVDKYKVGKIQIRTKKKRKLEFINLY